MSIEPVKVKPEYKLVQVVSNGGAGNRGVRQLRMVQNFDYSQNIASEHVKELGDDKIVSTVYDPVTCDVSIDTNVSEFSWANLAMVCGKDMSKTTITEADFDDAVCAVLVKGSVDGSTVDNTLLLPSAFVSNVDISISVDGIATENYRLTSNMDESFINAYKDAYGEALAGGTFAAGSTTWTTVASATGNVPIYLYVDGVKYSAVAPAAEFTWATNTVTVTGVDLSGAKHVELIYAKSAAAAFAMITPDTDDVGGIKGKDITLALAYDAEPGATDKLLRAQNATISLPLTRTALREIGTEDPIDQALSKPLEFTVSLDFLESDLRRYANEIAGQNFSTDDVLNPKLFMGRQALQLKVTIDDATGTNHETILCDNLRVTGHGSSMTVNGQGAVRWQFVFDTITFTKAA